MASAKLYVMQAPDGAVKVGYSKNPEGRRKSLGKDVALVHETDVLDDVRRVEDLAHRALALNGTHLRGEWFEASLDDAISAIETAVRQAEGQEMELGGKFKSGRGRPAKPAGGEIQAMYDSDERRRQGDRYAQG